MVRLAGFEPNDPSPMKGSPEGACPLWLLPRSSGKSFPRTPLATGSDRSPPATSLSARRRVLILVRLTGFEPMAHSLEGCCSIQLSYRRFAEKLVGARGFEPPTSCSQSRRATGLRHAPGYRHSYPDVAPIILRLPCVVKRYMLPNTRFYELFGDVDVNMTAAFPGISLEKALILYYDNIQWKSASVR